MNQEAEGPSPISAGNAWPSVVLAGEESAGLSVLRALHKSEADLRLVLSDGPAAKLALSLGYDVEPAERVKDPSFGAELEGIDLLLNVHSLYIMADEVLSAPRLGSFNVHPGPLPEYAGLNTPCWAVYEGASEYGVTLHRMVAEIDGGDVVFQRRWRLDGDETGLALYARCSREGVALVKELIARVARDECDIPRIPQDASSRRYYGRKPPADGRIRWASTAVEIERFVRACRFGPYPSPWGRPVARILGEDRMVVEAKILCGTNGASAGLARGAPAGTAPDVGPGISGDTEPGTACELGDDWFRVATGTLPMRVRAHRADGAG